MNLLVSIKLATHVIQLNKSQKQKVQIEKCQTFKYFASDYNSSLLRLLHFCSIQCYSSNL